MLESLARQHSLPSLLAFSALHEQIQLSTTGSGSDLIQTERFVLDEVLQLVCDRALGITRADGVIVALSEGSALVCRAGSGPLAVERGVHLVPDSEFLQECLDSGRIFCCDDSEVDTRLELDLARMLCARSTVIVPLRGPRKVIGVLQIFAQRPFAFTDSDLRTFDLFGELLLSALKPQDQDRRLDWLADVADAILVPQRAVAPIQSPAIAEPVENEEPEVSKADDEFVAVEPSFEACEMPALQSRPELFEEVSELRAETFEPAVLADLTSQQQKSLRRFMPSFTLPIASRPGLSGVLALVAIAALFSAGVWWGMQNREMSGKKSADLPTTASPREVAPSSSAASDHLLDASNAENQISPAPSLTASQLAVLPKITSVRHWSSSVGSTVVIDMEDQVPYEVHRLTSPERIYFDLHDTALVPDLDGKNIEVSDASLTRVRVAQPVAGVTRVVLDTRNGSNFSVSMESNPYRLIIELRDSAKTQLFASAKPLSSLARSAQTALLPQTGRRDDDQLKAAIGHFRIVLDAGHGGWDLGTVGRDGLLEKDLVLDVAERLGNLLKNRLSAEVIFTRTSDQYLALDQRAEIANQSQADLFVSVHANYSNVASARGVETYYTNFFSPPGSREIEKRENGTLPRPTPVALSAGELHEKIEESRQLAASVQRSLYSTLAFRSPGIRDRGVKDSAFVVLTGTTMPAILTEISFVSSPADEQNLQSESYRQQIAEALYKGISRYEAGAHHHVKIAQVRQTSAQR